MLKKLSNIHMLKKLSTTLRWMVSFVWARACMRVLWYNKLPIDPNWEKLSICHLRISVIFLACCCCASCGQKYYRYFCLLFSKTLKSWTKKWNISIVKQYQSYSKKKRIFCKIEIQQSISWIKSEVAGYFVFHKDHGLLWVSLG